MKKIIIYMLMLALVILSSFSCNRFNSNDSWEIIDTILYVYSDEGVDSLTKDKALIMDYNNCETVVFGDLVTEIPNSFFANNSSIKTIQIGNGVLTIGDKAFYSCENLSTIKWSKSLKHIGVSAFENTAITELNLPNGLETIDDFAFSNCSKLRSCFIPDTVNEMGCNFTDCAMLQQIQLSSSLKELSDYCFSGCTSLRQIKIPSSIRVMGYDAFSDSGIEKIIIEGELDEIRSLRTSCMPRLTQIVFCSKPPKVFEMHGSYFGLMNNSTSNVEVYCIKMFSNEFQINDGVWNGFRIVIVNEPSELPLC